MQHCKVKKLVAFRHNKHDDMIVVVHPNGSCCVWHEIDFFQNLHKNVEFARKGVCSLKWSDWKDDLYKAPDRVYFNLANLV